MDEAPKYNLRPLWDELLKIYGVFASLCEKHHLRFYADGGTALGTARHKGFIPWDDDMDFYMPRPDYEKFIAVAHDELPPGYVWSSVETDPEYDLPFGKIAVRHEGLVERISSETGLDMGKELFIDVLPLDGIPSGGVSFWIWLGFRTVWKHMPSFLIANQRARILFQKIFGFIDYDSAKRVEEIKESAKRLRRTAWTPGTFGEQVWMDFENVKMAMPHDWDECLRGMYGRDYMQLPPPEERKPSHIIA